MPIERDVEHDQFEGIDYEKFAEEQKQEAVEDAERKWEKNLEQSNWRNTGEGIDSIHTMTDENGNTLLLSDAVQLFVAEFGRPPTPGHPPPFQDIKEWAQEKGLTPGPDETFDEMVEAIRWSIAEEGIEGFQPGSRAFHDAAKDAERRDQRRIEEELEKHSKGEE